MRCRGCNCMRYNFPAVSRNAEGVLTQFCDVCAKCGWLYICVWDTRHRAIFSGSFLKIWQLELRRRYVNIWSKLMERELGFKKCYHKYMFCRVNLEMLLAHIFCSIHRGCAVGCCYFLRIWHNDWRCRYVRIRNKPMQCAMRSIVLLADIFP